MTFRKIAFSPISNRPEAVSAILFASIQRELAALGVPELFSEVVSVSLSGTDVTVRVTGKLAASELELRSPQLVAAMTKSLSDIYPERKYRLRIK